MPKWLAVIEHGTHGISQQVKNVTLAQTEAMGTDVTSVRGDGENGGCTPAAGPVNISWENRLKSEDNRSGPGFTPCCVMG